MAEQKRKSQAERAASASKSKSSAAKSRASQKGKNSANGKKVTDDEERLIPVRYISAFVCLVVFILLVVAFMQPDGALTKLFENIVLGLLGKVGFLIAIPVTLYLFIILIGSGKRPVLMRCICGACFVLCCGCLSHLTLNAELKNQGFAVVAELYQGGMQGTTGGLICGSLTVFLQWILGYILSFILLVVSAVMTLLGAMQITLPSIVRAIKNRPRAEWMEEEPERLEPAAIVVNHIANKRIEYVEHKRARAERIQAEQAAEKEKPAQEAKVKDMLRQIDGETATPVAAAVPVQADREEDREIMAPAEEKVQPKQPAKAPQPVTFEIAIPEPVPEKMPVLKPDMEIQQPESKKVTSKEAAESALEVAQEIAVADTLEKPEYCFPPIDLLNPAKSGGEDGTQEMRENTRRLNETLESFKIEAHIINVTRGPSVTRYEVELEKGVRLNKLTSVADDIALSLGASGVRIAAVPDKISVVGIEVPNRAVSMVSLREVIDSAAFHRAKSKSSFAVGKDIGGNCIVGNIAKLPHMLIAGTTGSGKSVCMNSIIISLLYKASPDDVKLIMVDPKMVELGIYNGIPHLLIPVVTDPKKAAGSLQWAVTEMMRRYRAMSDMGVRDLDSYNSIVTTQDPEGKKLPQVVVIIDELADLMLVAAKEVEESICRIAQMGRAAGIHLIIATQRPSADVITGLMKANIPSRIAFAVASAMESRIILDTQGAEKLVGKGDMLYAPIGIGKPTRVQGCFVSDGEVEAVATYVKEHYITDYDQQVMEEIERKAAQTGSTKSTGEIEPNSDELAGDEMLPAAVEVILETGQASVSMLQRRLKLGYARAARIVDEMEEHGIVGPFQGSKPRNILITKEQWTAMQSGQPISCDPANQEVDEEDNFLDDEV